jgi:hypothetical protein
LYPAKQWLDFVYTHELPHWHLVLSLQSASRSSSVLLSDKHQFAQQLAAYGLATIPTQMLLPAGATPTQSLLFSQQAWFIKPNIGNASLGCMTLLFSGKSSNSSQTYQLRDFLSGKLLAEGQQAIQDLIAQRQQNQNLLMQECLENHQCIADLIGQRDQMTIRVITARVASGYKSVCALVEIPLQQDQSHYLMIAVDCKNGNLLPINKNHLLNKNQWSEEATDLLNKLRIVTLPRWDEVVDVCCQAHKQFADILTIGWDVVIATQGVLLVEGNSNWAVAAHQIQATGPILQQQLFQIYSNNQKHIIE